MPRRDLPDDSPLLELREFTGRSATRYRTLAIALLGAFMMLGVAGVTILSRVRVAARASGSGELQLYHAEVLRSAESGVVQAVHVEPGDTVAPGQIILELGTRGANEELATLTAERELAVLAQQRILAAAVLENRQSAAAVAQADAQVNRATVQYLQRVAELGLPQTLDADTSSQRVRFSLTPERSAVRVADAAAEQARVNLEMLDLRRFELARHVHEIARLDAAIRSVRARIARLTIRSSVHGVVTLQRSVLLTGARVTTGDEIGTVHEPNVWFARVWLATSELPFLIPGALVQVRCPELRDVGWLSIQGSVETVSMGSASASAARPTNTVATASRVDVLVKLTLPDSLRNLADYLRPGMAVETSIERGHRSLFSHLFRTLLGNRT